jgi:putative transposase
MIMDLFNREIISFHRSKTLMAMDTTIPALKKAYEKRKPSNLIFHSDKGVQYACDEFKELLKKYGFRQSMSGKGNCYDNAPSESFFKTLKSELIYLKKGGYLTIKQAGAEIFEFIECFYNTIRLHSFLGFLSPKNYMKLFMQNKIISL